MYDPEGTGVVNFVDDRFAREIIFAQMDKDGIRIGYDSPPKRKPPDNGEFSELDPNPGRSGGDSAVELSYH